MAVVRTRFAPSPTGYLHVGGVRTALFAWLLARQADKNGKFILRLEDTDKAREVSGSGQHIMESLRWLGINWDEGIEVGGPFGPYKQSERLDIYREWAQKLVNSRRAYADPYTKAEVDAFRDQAKIAKKPFLYRDHRPENPPQWDGHLPLRLKSDPKNYKWHDAVMGDLTTGPEVIDDFILIKADGFPTYNFAHIVDDYLMQCTHVMRSQEFLASVPKYLNLYEALNIKPPVLATVPLVLGPSGQKKLSKRDGAKDVLDYARDGYLPEAMLNFMASLGWNDGTEQEIFNPEQLIEKFSLDHVQRGGARFDEKRLLWLNGAHIRGLEPDELYKRSQLFWPAEVKNANAGYKKAILALLQERLKTLGEIPSLSQFFFSEPQPNKVRELFNNPPDKQLQKSGSAGFKDLLSASLTALKEIDFELDNISRALNELLDKLQTKPGVLFALIRIAITGSESSPNIAGSLAVLGKDKSLARLEAALKLL